MIEFKALSLNLNNKIILENCNTVFKEGDKIVITGDSGSGKTTILNLIMGLAEADEGSIFFRGSKLSSENISEIRKSIAYIGQEPALGGTTVAEALDLPFKFKSNRGAEPDEKNITGILNFLLLDKDIREKNINSISGGEKQRIAIARALLLGKRIFLADEITSALDNTVIKQLYSLFSTEEYSLISVSHDPAWISFCSRRLNLKDGALTEVKP
ncbi:MAG: ATP-binding cassette domain-containing protein [Spirochaetales bacterium]|uniref:ATP-binding cassette domain-containing protein n=1 Tax=Candidatus Thalassospirochaeta sargassi TaxID=3119039 RepID=A0AAJ1ICK8_9SPIO|nr:ATP-binding cassette domain-containing protein [Spirochaetales bacterium]